MKQRNPYFYNANQGGRSLTLMDKKNGYTVPNAVIKVVTDKAGYLVTSIAVRHNGTGKGFDLAVDATLSALNHVIKTTEASE